MIKMEDGVNGYETNALKTFFSFISDEDLRELVACKKRESFLKKSFLKSSIMFTVKYAFSKQQTRLPYLRRS